MTVYVDDMYLTEMGRFRRMKMSHMLADTDEELHRFADLIGLKRKWFQNKSSGPHYDVSLSVRERAVCNGAVEITLRQCGYMNMVRRMTGALPKPEEAEAAYRALKTANKVLNMEKGAQ